MKPHEIDHALSKLPRHRSPKTLDDKIKAYAREQAPKRVSGLSPWMRGLAFASVAAVTVLVILPQQPVDSPEPMITAETQLAKRQDLPAMKKEFAAAVKPAAPAMDKSGSSKTENAVSSGLKIQALTRKQASDDSDRAQPQRYSSTMAAQVDWADKALAKESINIQQEMEKIQTLLNQGQTEQAQEAWKALKARCTACDLPDALDAALEKFAKDTP